MFQSHGPCLLGTYILMGEICSTQRNVSLKTSVCDTCKRESLLSGVLRRSGQGGLLGRGDICTET